MAEVQDEDQWLYGDEKEDGKEDEEDENETETETVQNGVKDTAQDEGSPKKSNEADVTQDGSTADRPEKDGSKSPSGDNEEKGSSSDDDDEDDDLTVTIGEVKKQSDIIADIIQPTAHPARFQPKAAPSSGLKDEDFLNPGKINGVPVGDTDIINDYEEKPWRKPGADLSDYFNYGFIEDTWLKYCEKQKRMRIAESKTGLSGLGGNLAKSVTILTDGGKYSSQRRPISQPVMRSKTSDLKSEGNTIEVMTAERRAYSTKAIASYNNDKMDFGGGDQYNKSSNNTAPYYNPEAPPPTFFSAPPPFTSGDSWNQSVGTPPPNAANWVGHSPVGPPPTLSVPPPGVHYDEDSRSSRRVSPEDDHHRSRRRHHERHRSGSPSRHRRRSRSRSPSHSPHRHRRKKSKRDRED